MSNTQKFMSFLGGAAVAVAFVFVLVPSVHAQQNPMCLISRDLSVGVTGDDVLCLQRYLNSSGFVITAVGAGSPGNETQLYGSATRNAVVRWQTAKGIFPANGVFGPASRSRYQAEFVITPPVVITPTPIINRPSDDRDDDETSDMREAREAITDLIDDIETLEEDIEDAQDDGDSIGNALSYRDAANRKLTDAFYSFFDEDYDDALDDVDDAQEEIEDARDEFDSNDADEDEAEDALEDIEEELEDARDEVDEADEDGDDVDEAEDLLDEADDLFEEAEDAFDDEDYDDVLDLVDEIEDLIEEALDSL